MEFGEEWNMRQLDMIIGRYINIETPTDDELDSVINSIDKLTSESSNTDAIDSDNMRSIGLRLIARLRRALEEEDIEFLGKYNFEKVSKILGIYAEYKLIECYFSQEDDNVRFPTLLTALSNGHVAEDTSLVLLSESQLLKWPVIDWLRANPNAGEVDPARIASLFGFEVQDIGLREG